MTIKLPCFSIEITLGTEDPEMPGLYLNGVIESDLHEEDDNVCTCGHDEFCVYCYNRVIDGIEALILAHACAGVDIESPGYIEGIETAVDGARNNNGK